MSDTNNDNETGSDHDHSTPLFFLIFMGLLAMVLLIGRSLHHRPKLNSFLSEPAMVLLVGMFFSFMIKLWLVDDYTIDSSKGAAQYDDALDDDGSSTTTTTLASEISSTFLSFSGRVFFMALLPPILFNSGYELKRELFFRHIKPIVSFAAVGTTVSASVTALLLWGVQKAGWMGVVHPTLLELLCFGALIAATDTVSVLGVLQAKKVDPHLFSLVFGESALNDAVAIVLFRSFSHLVQIGVDSTQTLVEEMVSFAVEFLLEAVGSPALGIIFSFGAALLFKHLDFRSTPIIELSLYVLVMYVPFLLAEVLHLSGIVAIFFTGMSARRYIEPNVSDHTKQNAEAIFKLVAYLAETCIFLDLGLSVFGFSGSFHWQFILFSFLAALLGRAASIYPISFLWNLSLQVTTDEPLLPASRRQPRRATIDHATPQATMDGHTTAAHDSHLSSPLTSDGSARPSPIDIDGTGNRNDLAMPDNNDNNFEDDDLSVSSASTTSSASSGSFSTSLHPGVFRRRRRKRRTTPDKRLDKVIPVKFMHVLWFAGLRGAVAYACARDFPNLYGNNDEIVAATMVIVLITIIIMGGFCEQLLSLLDIRMDVNDKAYMKEWRLRRSLKGAFHDFEKKFVFDVVVRETGDTDVELVTQKGMSRAKEYAAPRLETDRPSSDGDATAGVEASTTADGMQTFLARDDPEVAEKELATLT